MNAFMKLRLEFAALKRGECLVCELNRINEMKEMFGLEDDL
jgi:hypothetical protein